MVISSDTCYREIVTASLNTGGDRAVLDSFQMGALCTEVLNDHGSTKALLPSPSAALPDNIIGLDT